MKVSKTRPSRAAQSSCDSSLSPRRFASGVETLAKKQRTRGGAVLFVEHDAPGRDPAPSKALRREERRDRLQQALVDLSPDYREAIELVRIRGLQVKEAAERMNRTPKAVMHLLARGLKELKSAFGDTESLSLPPEEPNERRDQNDA